MEKERSSRTLYCPLVGLGTKAWLVVPMRSQEVSEPSMELVHWADGRTTTKRLRVSYFYSELLHILQKKKNQRSGTQRNGRLIAYNLDVLQRYYPKKC